jgi:hypothetical protein
MKQIKVKNDITQIRFGDLATKDFITEKIDYLAKLIARGFTEMDKRFDAIDARFDRIENITLRDHENRIERLEDGQRVVKTYLKI